MAPFTRIAALPLLAACALAATGAGAGNSHQFEAVNAAGVCQGALPAFAGTLRARPMALQNEGNAAAFVSCSIASGDLNTGREVNAVYVQVFNSGTVDRTFSCTLVDGAYGVADYLTRSITLPPNGGQSVLFMPGDLPIPSTRFRQPNVSCQLPPSIGLYQIGHNFPL